MGRRGGPGKDKPRRPGGVNGRVSSGGVGGRGLQGRWQRQRQKGRRPLLSCRCSVFEDLQVGQAAAQVLEAGQVEAPSQAELSQAGALEQGLE